MANENELPSDETLEETPTQESEELIDEEGNYIDAEGNLHEAGSPEATAAAERLNVSEESDSEAVPEEQSSEEETSDEESTAEETPPEVVEPVDEEAVPEDTPVAEQTQPEEEEPYDGGVEEEDTSPTPTEPEVVDGDTLLEEPPTEEESEETPPATPPEIAPEPEEADDNTFQIEPLEEEEQGDEEQDLRVFYQGKLPVDELAAWDMPTLILYHEKGVRPSKTKRGNWPTDLRRKRNPETWTANELLDWIEELIKAPQGVDEDIVWDEVYRRYGLPYGYTYEDAKAFILKGIKPATTASGFLVNDRSREIKTLKHWTYAELRAAALGEFEHPYTVEELASAMRERLNLNETYSTERLLDDLSNAPKEASVDNKLLKSTLDEYAKFMTGKGPYLTEASAAKGQLMLYRAIRRIMARDYVQFHEGWVILLDFINEKYNSLFTPDKSRRGWSQLGLASGARTTFEDLLTLMIETRNPRDRKRAASLFNLETILRSVSSETERQNVLMFYSE